MQGGNINVQPNQPFHYIMNTNDYILSCTYRDGGRFIKSINDTITHMKNLVTTDDLTQMLQKITRGGRRSILSTRLIDTQNIIEIIVSAFGQLMDRKLVTLIIKTLTPNKLASSRWITALKQKGYRFDDKQNNDLCDSGYMASEVTGKMTYYDIFIPVIREGTVHSVFINDSILMNNRYNEYVTRVRGAVDNKSIQLPDNLLITTLNYLQPINTIKIMDIVKYIYKLHCFVEEVDGSITNTFDQLIDQMTKYIKPGIDFLKDDAAYVFSKKIISFYQHPDLEQYADNLHILSIFMFSDIPNYNPIRNIFYLYEIHGYRIIDMLVSRGYIDGLSIMGRALINSLHIVQHPDLNNIMCRNIPTLELDRLVDNYVTFGIDFTELCEYKYILTNKYVDRMIMVPSLSNINRTINGTSYSRMIYDLYVQTPIVRSSYDPLIFSRYIYQSLSKRDQEILSRIDIYEWAMVKTILRYDITITKELLVALMLNNQIVGLIRLLCSHPKYDPVIHLFDQSIAEYAINLNERRWIRRNILENKPNSFAINLDDRMAYDQNMQIDRIKDPMYHQIIKNPQLYFYAIDVKKRDEMISKQIR